MYNDVYNHTCNCWLSADNGNIANQIQGFTIDYGKFILTAIRELSQQNCTPHMEYDYLSLLNGRYIVAVTVVICPTTINFREQEVKSANRRNPCFSLANRYADHFRLFAMNINVYKNLPLIDRYTPQYVEMIQSKFPEPWGELSMHYTSYDSTESNKTLIEACPQDLQPSHRPN